MVGGGKQDPFHYLAMQEATDLHHAGVRFTTEFINGGARLVCVAHPATRLPEREWRSSLPAAEPAVAAPSARRVSATSRRPLVSTSIAVSAAPQRGSRCGDSRPGSASKRSDRLLLDVQLDPAADLRCALGIDPHDEVGSSPRRSAVDVMLELRVDVGLGAELLDEVDDRRDTGALAGQRDRLGPQSDRDPAGPGGLWSARGTGTTVDPIVTPSAPMVPSIRFIAGEPMNPRRTR